MKENDIVKREFLIYSDENSNVKVEVMLINDDLWLTQELIANLFGKARNTISGHIKNIFEEGELDEKAMSKKSTLQILINQ